MSFKIREAKNDDCIAVKSLVFSVLEEYGLKPDNTATGQDLDDFYKFYFHNHGYFAVAIDQGNIVGSVGILRIDGNTCELRKMFTLPEVRGKDLGKSLLNLALEKGREFGYQHMTLQTASPLVEAITLYKKFGFREYQSNRLTSRCDKAFEVVL